MDLIYLNHFLRKINPRAAILNKYVDFPEGNMFWAKINAIYQIFHLYPKIVFTKKNILMIERYFSKIWVFLVKINGFFYKKIFKHL